MDDMQAIEQRISREMLRRAGPSESVDDLAVFEAVAAANRQHGWGFTVFSALKFIAASAIVALFGGFLLSGVLLTQQGDQVVPGAATESPSPMTAQMLEDMYLEGWNNNDLALLEETYAADAVHTAAYFDGMAIADGRDAVIDAAMGPTSVTTIAPIVELEAPDGELHWVAFGNLSGPRASVKGVVCNLWARDGQIVRHDCMLPMACLSGVCTR
jgi:hypothetical protein